MPLLQKLRPALLVNLALYVLGAEATELVARVAVAKLAERWREMHPVRAKNPCVHSKRLAHHRCGGRGAGGRAGPAGPLRSGAAQEEEEEDAELEPPRTSIC